MRESCFPTEAAVGDWLSAEAEQREKRGIETDDKFNSIFKCFFILSVGICADRCAGDRGLYNRRKMEKE